MFFLFGRSASSRRAAWSPDQCIHRLCTATKSISVRSGGSGIHLLLLPRPACSALFTVLRPRHLVQWMHALQPLSSFPRLVALLGGTLLLESGVVVVSRVGAGHVKAVPVDLGQYSKPAEPTECVIGDSDGGSGSSRTRRRRRRYHQGLEGRFVSTRHPSTVAHVGSMDRAKRGRRLR
jgi:hypothetical protein